MAVNIWESHEALVLVKHSGYCLYANKLQWIKINMAIEKGCS